MSQTLNQQAAPIRDEDILEVALEHFWAAPDGNAGGVEAVVEFCRNVFTDKAAEKAEAALAVLRAQGEPTPDLIHRMAVAINDARYNTPIWIDRDRPGWENEDKHSREYAERLARAAFASLPAPQDQPAAWLYDFCDPVTCSVHQRFADSNPSGTSSRISNVRALYTVPPTSEPVAVKALEIRQSLEDCQKFAREWSGSAFLSGDDLPQDAMTIAEHKAELYSGLCRLGSHMEWLLDELPAPVRAATEAKGDVSEQLRLWIWEQIEQHGDDLAAVLPTFDLVLNKIDEFRSVEPEAKADVGALHKSGGPVFLKDCPIGLFINAYGGLCLKTKYGSNEGRIDAYIVNSGEFFWGEHPQTIENQRMQVVQPVAAALNLDSQKDRAK